MSETKDTMTLEQFNEFAKNLPENQRKSVARTLGVKLPILPLSEQLEAVHVKAHVVKETKANPSPKEKTYVVVPKLDVAKNNSARGFWVNTEVARSVAERILEVCDENDL